MIDLEI